MLGEAHGKSPDKALMCQELLTPMCPLSLQSSHSICSSHRIGPDGKTEALEEVRFYKIGVEKQFLFSVINAHPV